MRVKILRQTFPAGGGSVFGAGIMMDLDPSVVRRLPADSYLVLDQEKKAARGTRDKMIRRAADKSF